MKRYLVQKAWHYRKAGKFEDNALYLTLKEARAYVNGHPKETTYGYTAWRIVKLVTQ